MSVAKVMKIWDETPTLLGVALAAPEIEAAHHAPGQFITLSASSRSRAPPGTASSSW